MFVGRDRELDALDAALARLSSNGSLYLITGEPGIGKTRLASELVEHARERGIRATWGQCWEAGGAPAFWPWREACEEVGIKFPDPAAIANPDPSEARFALFRDVASLLGREAARAPFVVVFEDLHAADRSTLLLLEFIAPQLRTLPILVIGTYRDLEASLDPDTAGALGRAGRSGRIFQLARLREADVSALVHDAIADADDRLVATVYETTLGNPLFVDEVVRDVHAHGLGGRVPLGVREVIRQRLALISSEARRVLEAGAVLGVEFGATDAMRIEADAAAWLDDAARSGLIIGTR